MTDLNKLESKRQGVFGMMAGSTHPRTGKLVTAEAETLRIIELVNDYGDVLKRLEAAEKRVAELEYSCKVSDGACSIAEQQRGHWMHRANVAEAELARRDATTSDIRVKKALLWISRVMVERPGMKEAITCDEMLRAYPTQPAALPPEMKAEPEKHDVIDHGFIAGYNKAIADAKALGCQPPKVVVLPKPERLDGSGYGYYLDMNDVYVGLEAAGVKWKQAAGGSIADE